MPPPQRLNMEYPCSYNLRVIVKQHAEAEQLLTELVLRHVPASDFNGMTARNSREGNYIAYVIQLFITSQQQLEALYQELNRHELVKLSL
jgi:putative lipoic acid-binding regulatory protein